MIFDKFWGSSTSIPIVNLNEIYSPPIQYENLTGIKLKMTAKDLIAIEGNKKFRILDGSKSFDYYDTVKVYYPDTEFERTNVIFLLFEEKQLRIQYTL